MPRSGADTRERLLAAGSRLFADEGVHTVPLSRVVAEAGQKNTSALHYHFRAEGLDARDALLFAIIDAHNTDIEAERRVLLDGLSHPTLRDLVEAVVRPMAAKLATVEGREFLSIISQLVDLFDRWDDPRSPSEARRAFLAIGEALPERVEPAVRRERVTRFLEMTSEALGSRARLIAAGRRRRISDDTFVANLVDMSVGALSA